VLRAIVNEMLQVSGDLVCQFPGLEQKSRPGSLAGLLRCRHAYVANGGELCMYMLGQLIVLQLDLVVKWCIYYISISVNISTQRNKNQVVQQHREESTSRAHWVARSRHVPLSV
jgi:hypothetical protein